MQLCQPVQGRPVAKLVFSWGPRKVSHRVSFLLSPCFGLCKLDGPVGTYDGLVSSMDSILFRLSTTVVSLYSSVITFIT